jgi:hypothetical protein
MRFSASPTPWDNNISKAVFNSLTQQHLRGFTPTAHRKRDLTVRISRSISTEMADTAPAGWDESFPPSTLSGITEFRSEGLGFWNAAVDFARQLFERFYVVLNACVTRINFIGKKGIFQGFSKKCGQSLLSFVSLPVVHR